LGVYADRKMAELVPVMGGFLLHWQTTVTLALVPVLVYMKRR
jgi:hypothetical protein